MINKCVQFFISHRIKNLLGTGEFGSVHGGLLNETCESNGGTMEVAVKTMRQGAKEEERVKFLQEAAIMGQFKHANIVKILGIVLQDPVSVTEWTFATVTVLYFQCQHHFQ